MDKPIILDEIIRRELKWSRRLWKFFFPPKPLTLKELKKYVKKLKKINEI